MNQSKPFLALKSMLIDIGTANENWSNNLECMHIKYT